MLLELQNANTEEINKLLAFAMQNNMHLSLVDDNEDNYYLPGKPLTTQQLNDLIAKSRKSGIISMQAAHEIIRKSVIGDLALSRLEKELMQYVALLHEPQKKSLLNMIKVFANPSGNLSANITVEEYNEELEEAEAEFERGEYITHDELL